MDHIPLPQGSKAKSFKVPLFNSYTYDGLGLEGYPERLGFVHDGRLRDGVSTARLTSLLQAWLYFGLLTEFLGRRIDAVDLQELHSRILQSHVLPDLLDGWQDRLRSLGVVAADTELSRLHNILNQAIACSLWVDHCKDIDHCKNTDDKSFAIVALSVKLLISTLMDLYNSTYPKEQIPWTLRDLIPIRTVEDGGISPAADLLKARMISAGWCRQAALRACSSYTYRTAFFLLHLPRLRDRLRDRLQDASHSECSDRSCIAYNIDKTIYQTRHTTDQCSCDHVKIDTTSLIDIIKSGDTPLLEFEMTESGEVMMSLIRSNAKGFPPYYYCISHVWCDGLGNPHANSLPYCQVKRLHDIARRAGTSRLWMDTLCIPVGECDAVKTYKKKAIGSMAWIYNLSSGVIILDQEIREGCDAPTSSVLLSGDDSMANSKVLAYMMCSVWNYRCWCYQEAVLNPNYRLDTSTGLRVPPMLDIKFYPELFPRQPAARWAFWRTSLRPSHYLLSGIRFLSSLIPLQDVFTFMPRICCAPDAWVKLRDAMHSFARMPAVSLRNAVIAILWLLAIVPITLPTIPAAIALTILAYFAMLIFFIWYCVRLCVFAGPKYMRTKDVLAHQTRLRIATEMAAELQPPQIQHPERSSEMRVTQFAQAWNALAWRMATEPEDIHTILASLTDLVTYRNRSDFTNSAERMRAIVGSYENLPLSLLFSPSTVVDGTRDSSNAWLPIAPVGDVLSTGHKSLTLDVHADHVEVRLRETSRSIVAIKVSGRSLSNCDVHLGSIQTEYSLVTQVGAACFSEDQGRDLDECYLIELPASGELRKESHILRGARLLVHGSVGDHLRCSYLSPVEVRASRSSQNLAQTTTAERLHPGMSIIFDFNNKAPSGEAYRQGISMPQIGIVAITAGILLLLGLIFLIAVLGSQVSRLAFYIGFPVLFAIIVPFCIFTGPYVIRMEHAAYDKGQAKYRPTGFALFLIEWLRRVATNFQPKHGASQRWYQLLAGASYSPMRRSV